MPTSLKGNSLINKSISHIIGNIMFVVLFLAIFYLLNDKTLIISCLITLNL